MPVYPYRVTLKTTKGLINVHLNGTQGAEAAGRRAQFTLIHARSYGDVDQVTVVSVEPVCAWFGACENIAPGTVYHPIYGDIPCCVKCADIIGYQVTPFPQAG